MHMHTVVTFGDLLLRLSPPGYKRFLQADNFEAVYTGAEANVSVSLVNFGLQSKFITCAPKHEIGQAAVNFLNRYGVDTSCIVRKGERLGLFYSETGASQRASKIIYDRMHSAFCELKSGDIDWAAVLNGASWFHYTGVTPALGEGPRVVLLEALKEAKRLGVKVSADINYRKKLWPADEANKVMSEMMKYTDVAIGNEEDAELVFGIKATGADVAAGKIDEEGYFGVAREIASRFGCEKVAITLRESISASDNNWSAMLYDGKDCYTSARYKIHIVDRVGGGDSFAGGLIYSLITGKPIQEALEFAVAASCLKHSIPGDMNMVGASEAESLMKGNASGRVQR